MAIASQEYVKDLLGKVLKKWGHSHSNKDVLDKLSESGSTLYYDNKRVQTYTTTLPQYYNIYVSPSGNNSTGDGTSSKPFRTVDYAIYRARALNFQPYGGQ